MVQAPFGAFPVTKSSPRNSGLSVMLQLTVYDVQL